MNIDELRRNVSQIDDEITALLCRRLELCRKIGLIKKAQGLPVADCGTEKKKLDRIASRSGEYASEIETIYRTVFAVSRDIQGFEDKK